MSILSKRSLASALAAAFLAGEPTLDGIVARATQTLGRPWRWLRPLARRYGKNFASQTRPRHREVVRFLLEDPGFTRARTKYFDELSVVYRIVGAQRMRPVPAARKWNVPAIESVESLAEWFLLDPRDLLWLADLKELTRKKSNPRLRHYHYRALAKSSGSFRLIEAPKKRLKAMQQQLLTRILDGIPPHPAVHGFVRRRSIKTFVAPHVGQRVVLRMDLQDFFPSFGAARIQAFFRTVGYPESVADLLGAICTNAVPGDVWKNLGREVDPALLREARALYTRPHLPQGAPMSPALANLCAYRMDCRLLGLAESVGGAYTRYADDLAFSGNETFERGIERFSTHVAAIAMEEGFSVHHRKTRIMRQAVRQHLAGVVTNQRINVRRTDFDRLKAILTNCVRQGPESQNREAHPHFCLHLEGKVGFVEMINPIKGKRMREIFGKIVWR